MCKVCFKLEDTTPEMQEILQRAYDDNTVGITETSKGISRFKYWVKVYQDPVAPPRVTNVEKV
jgi:hypothetical protein